MGYSLHHFVPQLYLRRFSDTRGLVYVYDKQEDRSFASTPRNIAAEHGLYKFPANDIVDPDYLENSFAIVEGEAAAIMDAWLAKLEAADEVNISAGIREAMSLYLSLQLLRTLEVRTQILELLSGTPKEAPSPQELQALHLALVWKEGLSEEIASTIGSFIWVFGRNVSQKPLWTSDDPVRVRQLSGPCLTWARIHEEGAYLSFPLSPRLILFCYDPRFGRRLREFEGRVSPILLTDELVEGENIPQVGHARRYVFTNNSEFSHAKEFCALHPDVKSQDRVRFRK